MSADQERIVFVNGFPQSGNHALVKAVQLLGLPARVEHVPFKDGAPADATHIVFTKRDPRNVIVSALRKEGQLVTPGTFLAKFRRFRVTSLRKELQAYDGWLNTAGQVVAYERLLEERTIRSLANYLGVPLHFGVVEQIPGLTRTYNAVRSDYRPIWTREVQHAFVHEGGAEMLLRWGYE